MQLRVCDLYNSCERSRPSSHLLIILRGHCGRVWRKGWQKTRLGVGVCIQRCSLKAGKHSIHFARTAASEHSARHHCSVQRCFTSTETVRTIRDGEPRMATSTFTQLLSSDSTGECQARKPLNTLPTVERVEKEQKRKITKSITWYKHSLYLQNADSFSPPPTPFLCCCSKLFLFYEFCLCFFSQNDVWLWGLR